MSDKINIIDYKITLNLMLYSALIYKIDCKNKEKNMKNITKKLKNNGEECLSLDILNKYYKNEYIVKYFYCELTHIHCMIVKNDIEKKIKIIFKGSTDHTHLEYNLKIKLTNIKFLNNDKIKIHYGFYNQVFEGKIYNKIIKYLQELNIDNYLIFYSGHSLGGVMATLFGYFSSFVFSNKIIIVSFGGSRIGNKFFKKSFEKKKNIICYRFNNENDIITQLPIINYEHVGIPINLKCSQNYNFLEEHNYESYLHSILKNTW